MPALGCAAQTLSLVGLASISAWDMTDRNHSPRRLLPKQSPHRSPDDFCQPRRPSGPVVCLGHWISGSTQSELQPGSVGKSKGYKPRAGALVPVGPPLCASCAPTGSGCGARSRLIWAPNFTVYIYHLVCVSCPWRSVSGSPREETGQSHPASRSRGDFPVSSLHWQSLC